MLIMDRRTRILGILLSVFLLPALLSAEDWTPLVDRLAGDGLDEDMIEELFSRPEVRFEPEVITTKIQELLRKRQKTAPGAARKFRGVYEGFLRPEVIECAHVFSRENEMELAEVQKNFCVPKEIVVSIMLVETRLGSYLGMRCAFNNLASMAIASDFDRVRPYLPRDLITPSNEKFVRIRCRVKAEWAYKELKALIDYAENNGLDPVKIPGSIYGAIGLCQFMPSHAFNFGIDADGDGKIDLFAKPDALHSIANYLRGHGWKCNMTRTGQHRVILAYNHSRAYANTILAVAERLKEKAALVRK
ncbi:MAG: lytic murein transglycosylase [Syntrophales bacterium]|nr:lytic murein transglycosylase [Syntrophales bacterium]MDD5232428.1 lytic murein transglycosylase [Syntrophales bacterium]MDD5531960.1 lytic murein transglycosylase [Syntrophales bacterium]HPL64804.1 lytic murein transglycosylase [Syntrophales bacterium]